VRLLCGCLPRVYYPGCLRLGFWMKLCRERLENDFSELAKFGPLESGGFTRVAFSPEDMAARRWLQTAMEAAGLKVTVDAVGNIRGRRAGLADLPPVMLGSHLDTVPQGGNYDGSVGVLAALEVVRVLNDSQLETKRPIEIINFSAEESSRFGVATIGSKALTGKLTLEALHQLVDRDGYSLYETLKDAGYRPDDIDRSVLENGQVYAFLELHIEQGPVLEERQCSIGIVTSIAAPSRFKVVIEGRADHSGNTPMAMRRDALAGASELVLGVEQIATNFSGKDTVGTVGYLDVMPGAMNVIPGRVELGIDIRDVCKTDKDSAVEQVVSLLKQIEKKRELTVSYDLLCDDWPVALADRVTRLLENCAVETKLAYLNMPSGAGHDAMNMAQIADAGMIFIPSVGGISHNIEEFSQMEDICAGTELLLAATLQLAQE